MAENSKAPNSTEQKPPCFKSFFNTSDSLAGPLLYSGCLVPGQVGPPVRHAALRRSWNRTLADSCLFFKSTALTLILAWHPHLGKFTDEECARRHTSNKGNWNACARNMGQSQKIHEALLIRYTAPYYSIEPVPRGITGD